MTAEFSRTMPAAADQLPPLLDSIETWLDDAGVPAGDAAPLMIALDEVLSNIINYGGETIELKIELAGEQLEAVIADDGPPFDPLARAAPDTGLGIDDREIGGLGIHLVREMMDEVGYAYENGQNRLTFSKTL